MSKTIWKFELEPTDEQFIEMPMGYELLSVAMQNGRLYFWVVVRPNNPPVTAQIRIFGAGNPVEYGSMKFLGTVLDTQLWHVFGV